MRTSNDGQSKKIKSECHLCPAPGNSIAAVAGRFIDAAVNQVDKENARSAIKVISYFPRLYISTFITIVRAPGDKCALDRASPAHQTGFAVSGAELGFETAIDAPDFFHVIEVAPQAHAKAG